MIANTASPIAGVLTKAQARGGIRNAKSLEAASQYFSISFPEIAQYKEYSRFVQVVLRESSNDSETLCLAVNTDTASVVEIGNRLL